VRLLNNSFAFECFDAAADEKIGILLEGSVDAPDDAAMLATNGVQQAMDSYFSSKQLLSQYEELVTTKTSNGMPLKWDAMVIPPNLQFRLHSHKNVECIKVIRGAMHEFRLKDTEVASFAHDSFTDERKEANLTKMRESEFEYKVCRWSDPNPFIVNEVGSCHLSFTKEDGALLLVLWSGFHYNYSLPSASPSSSSSSSLSSSSSSSSDSGAVRPHHLPLLDPLEVRLGYKI